MAEPNTTTIAAAAAGGISATLAGSMLGLGYDAILGGLLGGLIALMHQPPEPLARQAATLLGAVLTGAVWGPLAVAAALTYAPWVAGVGPGPLRIAAAAALGLVAQAAIPAAMAFIRRKGESAS